MSPFTIPIVPKLSPLDRLGLAIAQSPSLPALTTKWKPPPRVTLPWGDRGVPSHGILD